MHSDKAPGPDGYNAFFFQRNWETIGEDSNKAVHSFFKSGTLLSEVTHTFYDFRS